MIVIGAIILGLISMIVTTYLAHFTDDDLD